MNAFKLMKIVPLFVLVLFFSCNSFQNHIDEKSVEILTQYKKSIGGTEKLNTIKNFKNVGRWMEIEGVQTYIVKIPSKVFSEMKSSNLNEVVVFSDGELKMISNGIDVSGDVSYLIKEFELDAWLNPIAFGDELIDKCTYIGEIERDGLTYDEIKVEFKNGLVWNAEFDLETSVLSTIKRMGLMIHYKDYRDVNGVKFPFSCVYVTSNGETMNYVVDSIQWNYDLDENQFQIK